MGKILFFLLLAAVVWLLLKALLKKNTAASAKNSAASDVERMVKCDLCGVMMPESESAQLDDKRTCRAPGQCLHRQSM